MWSWLTTRCCGDCLCNQGSTLLAVALGLGLLASAIRFWFSAGSHTIDRYEYLTQRATSVFGRETRPRVDDYIGTGSFGDVYRGEYDGKPVIFKLTKTSVFDEGEIAMQFEHPSVVRTYAYGMAPIMSKQNLLPARRSLSIANRDIIKRQAHCDMQQQKSVDLDAVMPIQELWLAIEYCNGGSLKEWILHRDPHMDAIVQQATRYLLDVATAMEYLHGLDCIHGDLNSSNVLLHTAIGGRTQAKVGDFGLTRMTKNWTNNFKSTQAFGTITHMAPELLHSGRLSKMVDVYAFGMLAWEMNHSVPPFIDVTPVALSTAIMTGQRPKIGEHVPPHIRALIQQCWHRSISRRPAWDDIIRALQGGDIAQGLIRDAI